MLLVWYTHTHFVDLVLDVQYTQFGQIFLTISVFKLIFLHTVSAVSALFQYSILTKVDACKHEHSLLRTF